MNNRVAIQIALYLVLVAIIGAAAYSTGAAGALPYIMALGLASIMFYCVVTYMRHREIKRLTSEIEEVLTKGRSLEFCDYRESDVAVLGNTLRKTTDRLSRLTQLLASEKNSLASSLADVSHQIRTPLTAAELLLASIERTQSEAERKQQIRQLEQLLERISWLVTALLKIAKAEAGALPFEKRQVKALDAINRATSPLEMSLDLRNIELCVSAEEQASFIGDEYWCAEAIENIVKNAMESLSGESGIGLVGVGKKPIVDDGGTGHVSGGKICISASEDALACRIVVEDSGPGIAQEDLPHLFERFYRGSHNAPGQGFGIGLSLSRALITAQGGTLRADNKTAGEGTGARFTITFSKSVV